MIDPTQLAFDIDGVVADTMSLFLDIARDEFQVTHIDLADITCYHLDQCLDMDEATILAVIDRLLSGDYKSPLRPIDGAREVLLKIADLGTRLLFVTARPNPGPMPEWMAAFLGLPPPAYDIVYTGGFQAKIGVLQDHAIKWFVEDRLETCFALQEAGMVPVLFRQPWNREPHPFVEVGTWWELEGLIQFNGINAG